VVAPAHTVAGVSEPTCGHRHHEGRLPRM